MCGRQVREADEQFGLVLVAERMEKSLVLMAKYLCWELNDVLVLKVNSRRDEVRGKGNRKGQEKGSNVRHVLQSSFGLHSWRLYYVDEI